MQNNTVQVDQEYECDRWQAGTQATDGSTRQSERCMQVNMRISNEVQGANGRGRGVTVMVWPVVVVGRWW